MTHDVAVADCVKDGGFLVRIDSPQKNDFMVQIHQGLFAIIPYSSGRYFTIFLKFAY